MSTSAKRKGDGYEREIARWLDEALFGGEQKIFRMPLSGGGSHIGGGGRADIIGTPDVWVEAKRTERCQPYAAMEQAERGIKAAKSNEMPVVITRRNRVSTEDSLVMMRMKDWVALYESYIRVKDSVTIATLDEIELELEDDQEDEGVGLSPLNGGADG